MHAHCFISALFYALIGFETFISKPMVLSLPSSSLSSSLVDPLSPITSIADNQRPTEKTTNNGNKNRSSNNNNNIGNNENSNSPMSKTKSMCRISEWKCPDGTCIPLSKYCNGIPDCMDKSDELTGCSGKKEFT